MKVFTYIERTTLVTARDAAVKLKSELLQRFEDQLLATGVQPRSLEVVDIIFPDIDGADADKIGLYLHWTCHVRSPSSKRFFDYAKNLADLMPRAQLHHIFRKAFQVIEIPTEHVYAELFDSRADFIGSGIIATVTLESPLYIRPICSNRENSLFQNAMFRIDRNARLRETDYLIACIIDPFERHYLGLGPERFSYAHAKPSTIFIARQVGLPESLLLARIVSVATDGRNAILESAAGIEFFSPFA